MKTVDLTAVLHFVLIFRLNELLLLLMNVGSQWEKALLNLPGNLEHKWPCDGALKDAFF
jgi:hypothetical protein